MSSSSVCSYSSLFLQFVGLYTLIVCLFGRLEQRYALLPQPLLFALIIMIGGFIMLLVYLNKAGSEGGRRFSFYSGTLITSAYMRSYSELFLRFVGLAVLLVCFFGAVDKWYDLLPNPLLFVLPISLGAGLSALMTYLKARDEYIDG